MGHALALASQAARKNEVPVGCVVVSEKQVIARASNRIKRDRDPTAHAEVLALRQAAKKLNNERLNGTILYTTIEPCTMCAGAIVLARVAKVIYGAKDVKAGACGSVFKVIPSHKLNHRPCVVGGVLAQECGNLLKQFFKGKRRS